MPSSPEWLALHAVSRRRAGRPVLSPLTLGLRAGEVLGLLGVNGAGKSTALMLMAAVLAPDAGRVELNGVDLAEFPNRARDHIGYLPEQAPLWPELTVREQLDAHGRLRGRRGAALSVARDELLQRLDLAPLAQRLCAQLSLGQRQRVGLACALLHRPGLLVLDEPGNGLDPLQAERVRALLRERAADGAAIVISTHLLAEVETQCTRVAILHEGALRLDAPLHAHAGEWRIAVQPGESERARAVLAPLAQSIAIEEDARLRVQLRDGVDVAAVAPALLAAGVALRGLEPAAWTLAQTFTHIAGGGAARAA